MQVTNLLQEDIAVAKVAEGVLKARLLWGEQRAWSWRRCRCPARGSVLNPMHLVNKITGLREGQQWSVPLADPMAAGLAGITGKSQALSSVDASVTSVTLNWHEQEVPCFRIDYQGQGRKGDATTWVRQRDSVVLCQEAHYGGIALTLIRYLR